MSRYAILTPVGLCENVVEAEAAYATSQGWTAAPDEVGPGFTLSGETWTPPAARPRPPSPDVTAQADFVAALGAISTGSITDPAAKAAITDLIGLLAGTGGNVVVHAHPVR